MPGLFDSILGFFGSPGERRSDIVARLRAAQEDGERLELLPLGSLEADPPTLTLDIARVDESALILCPPPTEDARRLLHGRRFAMNFYESTGRVNGEIVCEGRVRIRDDDGSAGHGFRFTLPRTLMRVERRYEARHEIDTADAPAVELTSFEHQSPIYGVLVNLSHGGARIRCQNAKDKLHEGQEVYLKVTLPEPVGLVTEMVRVLDLSPCDESPELLASVSFHQHVRGLGDLLDGEDLRFAPRRAG